MQLLAIPIVRIVRSTIPRAAMLATVAGVSVTFLSMGFAFQIFQSPTVALLPMMLILISYIAQVCHLSLRLCFYVFFSSSLFIKFIYLFKKKVKMPLGIPGGFLALLVGVCLAWIYNLFGFDYFHPSSGKNFF